MPDNKTAHLPDVIPLAMMTVLRSVALDGATSRAEISRLTGLARSTVGQQVEVLLGCGLLTEEIMDSSVRGRPPHVLAVSTTAGTIAVADVEVNAVRLAVTDLSGTLILRSALTVDLARGPKAILGDLAAEWRDMLSRSGHDPDGIRQIVVGLPAPVDYQRGCAVRPPGMPGWDSFPVGSFLSQEFDVPVFVDNDANLAALGETARGKDTEKPLLAVRISSGIGAGLVTANGEVHRGADGAAGDIGHIRVPGYEEVLCSCGKRGCLEAVASCTAVLADLELTGGNDPEAGVKQLVHLLATGDAKTLSRVRDAGAVVGEIMATLVHVYNPRTLVLSGPMTEACDDLLSEVRSVVYRQALPLATRKLVITATRLEQTAGLIGGVVLAVREVFSDKGMESLITSVATSRKSLPPLQFPPVGSGDNNRQPGTAQLPAADWR